MSSYYGSKAVIHQAAPSIPSSTSRSSSSHRSSSSSYTMDSRGSSRSTRREREHREYDAAKYVSKTTSGPKVVVHNHNKGIDERYAPSPGYSTASGYNKKS